MQENKSSKRGMGPRVAEKPKNFKLAISRLFSELRDFKRLIFVALILAVAGAVLSIFTPNILSDLTDQISEGLVINSKNMEKISSNISKKLSQDSISSLLPNILKFDLSDEKIQKILSSNDFSSEDKSSFEKIINDMSNTDEKEKSFLKLISLPNNILKEIILDTEYNNINIPSADIIELLAMINGKENAKFPNSIAQVMLSDFSVDGKKISVEDQIEFLGIMNNLTKDDDVSKIYEKIDEMPINIQKTIKPKMNIKKIQQIVIFLVILQLMSALFTYIESISMTNVSNKFAQILRKKISLKINKLPLKYFDNNSTGDILSRVTNDVDTIAQSMNQSLASLVSAITLLLGTIIMMFITNWVMAITAIFASLLGFIFMFLVLGKSQKYFSQRQKELGNLNGHIEEIYSGLNVVKAYNGQKESDLKFNELNKKMYNANRKSQFLSGIMMPMMNFIGNFGYVSVCVVGALLTMNGNISFGVIVAFILYVRLFTSPLSQIAQGMTSLQSTAASSERVFEFLDEIEMSDQKDITIKLDKDKVKGEIEFENVVFQYDGTDKPTINGFSAKAYPGQKIAIVGPTGAGKTTMVNLLMKFYEINSGDIKIDGISTKNLTRQNIHELFTMILQDTWLFNGTIKENIVYNRKGVSDDRVREVCKTVGLDHFIKTMPNGYDSVVSNNDSVSAGQKQLLTIARGMIEDAPFLILDEATSNVDTRTEELVQKAMDKLTEGRTSFIIAHRLSTIKNADLILVMKDGNIIEQGNHEQLMKLNGFYSDLYNSQFEL